MTLLSKLVLSATLSTTLLFPVQKTQAAEPTAPTSFVLNQSETFDIKSKAGREYQIFVAAPAGEEPAEGYPIVYASDGNAMFPLITSIANILSMDKRAIFVGIGYRSEWPWDGRRNFDLTPKFTPAPNAAPRADGRPPVESGGNDVFLDFIENELKPVVEARYKVDKTRQTLFGHSYGGLFTLHALFTRPGTFQTYIAAAPSIFYGNQVILTEAKAFKEKGVPANNSLKLLLTHNTEPQRAEPRRVEERPNTAANRNQAESARDLEKDLKSVTGLTTEYRHYDNETHVSMLPSSVTSALLFALGETPRTPRQ